MIFICGKGYIMNKFYKIIEGKYIVAIGVNSGGKEISEKEYAEIKTLIDKQYATKSGNMWYRLRTDLTWEEIKPPVEKEVDDK